MEQEKIQNKIGVVDVWDITKKEESETYFLLIDLDKALKCSVQTLVYRFSGKEFIIEHQTLHFVNFKNLTEMYQLIKEITDYYKMKTILVIDGKEIN